MGIVALTSVTLPASAATWSGGRTTPSLREIAAVDATGESIWPYGQEDVAGDGLASFTPQEQAIDIRTAYAVADASTFWVRAYVSAEGAVGANVSVYVFIDSDASTATGGRASAPEINALLATDPSPGGYEFVVVVESTGAIGGIWQWRSAQSSYALLPDSQGTRAGEIGSDLDPIRIGPKLHGYVQAAISESTLDVAPVCGLNLFFRSINTTQGLGNGDLDVGRAGPCVPPDANGDSVPDVVVPASGCTIDAQCAGQGLCVDGACVLAAPCVTSASCAAGQICTADGRCVAQGGASCTTNDTCSGLVCVSGTCTACTPGGSECGAGRRCGPDGRCVAGAGGTGGAAADGGIALAPGDKVVGGAFNCAAGGSAGGAEGATLALFGAAIGSLASRRRRRSRRRMDDMPTPRSS